MTHDLPPEVVELVRAAREHLKQWPKSHNYPSILALEDALAKLAPPVDPDIEEAKAIAEKWKGRNITDYGVQFLVDDIAGAIKRGKRELERSGQ